MKVSEKYGIISLVLSSSVILILWSHYTIQFSAVKGQVVLVFYSDLTPLSTIYQLYRGIVLIVGVVLLVNQLYLKGI
jgi:hypothetical protein